MSVKVAELVWDLEIRRDEKLVLLAYADHANHEGGSIYPGVPTIARKTGYSERSVQLISRRLERAGLLIEDGKGPRGTNKWRIPVAGAAISALRPGGADSSPAQNGAEKGRADSSPVQNGAEKGGADSSPVQVDAARGAESDGEGVNPISPEPSLTVIEPSTRAALSQVEYEQADAKVTAMIENGSRTRYLNRDKIPEPYLIHADTYHALTGQEPTKRVLHDWLQTFSEWTTEGIEPEHVREAYKESLDRFTVARPGSLTNTAAAIKAKGRRTRNQEVGGAQATLRELERIERENALAVPPAAGLRTQLRAVLKSKSVDQERP